MQLKQVETKVGHVEKCLLKCGIAPMLSSSVNVCGPAHNGRHGANKKMRKEVHGCIDQDCTWNRCLIMQEARPSGRSALLQLHGYTLAPSQIKCQQRISCHVPTFHCLTVYFFYMAAAELSIHHYSERANLHLEAKPSRSCSQLSTVMLDVVQEKFPLRC